ncbi:hypothetical protein [uncultured Algibacter sp.]|uniref:hypothetical protein n=1 Tax=uncultured Algibacter sp. TaxID=298659 RepID=UPI002637DC25|nr:hypothetical protein [uncultured Algibacter sp.]
MKRLLFVLLTVSPFLLFNCSNNDDDNNQDEGFDGSIEDIRDFYNDDLVDALEDLGFNLNTGNNPPNIEGVYFVSPLLLEASSVTGDIVGMPFNDYTITFSNQNNSALTIDYFGDQGNQIDQGSGSFISGDDDNFTVLLITTSTDESNNTTADSAISISGVLTDGGIENIQMAFMMLDNKGNPNGEWIPNNTGRIAYDSDFNSPKQ